MELIKTPSFIAIDNLSEVLHKNNQKIPLEQLHKKLSQYLVNFGSKKFVEFYNDVAKNKNYKQAFTALNL
jgi:hypothetical protein